MNLSSRVLLAFLSTIVLAMGVQLYKRGCVFKDELEHHFDYNDIGSVFITGANIGIGLETARGLVRRGVHVILGCRSFERCQNARNELLRETPDKGFIHLGDIDVELIDLNSFPSVRDCAKRLQQNYPYLRVLVNNAGIMGAPAELSSVGYELHFSVNYLAHFLLTKLLLPHMKRTLTRLSDKVRSNGRSNSA